jgi:hypothetical protein
MIPALRLIQRGHKIVVVPLAKVVAPLKLCIWADAPRRCLTMAAMSGGNQA